MANARTEATLPHSAPVNVPSHAGAAGLLNYEGPGSPVAIAAQLHDERACRFGLGRGPRPPGSSEDLLLELLR